MAQKEVVLTRSEFVRRVQGKLRDKTDIGRMLRFVDSAFVLQGYSDRPCYLLEVEEDISQEDIEYLDAALASMGVCACIIPRGLVSYGGTLTRESMEE